MSAAEKLPPSKQSIQIAEVAKTSARELWERAARIALPIGAIGGFCADVLAPLGPLVAYLAFGTSLVCMLSGVIWYGIKRRQIQYALADGHIDAEEYEKITKTSTWPTVFAFTLVSSVVLILFFGAQRVFAGDEPENGAVANIFPFVQQFQRQVLKLQQSADRIEKSAARIEAGQDEIQKALSGLNEKLDDLNKRLGSLDKNSAAIEKPASPEDHYFNARLFELRGEALKARQSYVEYMKGQLPYLDPHLSLTSLMKLQDGAAAAHESYSLFVNGSDPSALVARAMLLDRGLRMNALERLAREFPDYAPTFYFLSRDYAAPEAGQQTLDNLKNERAALESLRALSDRGLFTKYFLDKRMAVAFESEANQRLRKFATMSDEYLNARAKLTVLPTEKGFEAVVTVPYDAAEIFVRKPGESGFKSLGFGNTMGGATGKPAPNTSVNLFGVVRGMVTIKYKDNQGKEFGPFEIEFDPAKEFVSLAKKMMPSNPSELAPVSMWKGKRSVTMVQLLMFRAALKKAEIGPTAAEFRHDLKLGALPKHFQVEELPGDSALVSQEVPLDWKNVFLRLEFVDGSFSQPIQIL